MRVFNLGLPLRKAFGLGKPRSGATFFARLSALWVTLADTVSTCLRSAATCLRPTTTDPRRRLRSLASVVSREITRSLTGCLGADPWEPANCCAAGRTPGHNRLLAQARDSFPRSSSAAL